MRVQQHQHCWNGRVYYSVTRKCDWLDKADNDEFQAWVAEQVKQLFNVCGTSPLFYADIKTGAKGVKVQYLQTIYIERKPKKK